MIGNLAHLTELLRDSETITDLEAQFDPTPCPGHRRNAAGRVVASCTHPADHPGEHVDVHTGSVWRAHRPPAPDTP